MPLWSLTQERVEKLRRQIGEIETEVDTLIKLTKEDLWRRDLDSFIEEWRAQLDEDHKQKRRINNMGRRTSTKVKVVATGATIKRRKGLGDTDDEDFKEGRKAKKPAPPKVRRVEVKPEKKQNTLEGFFQGNGTLGKNPAMNHDGNSSEIEPEPEVVEKAAEVKKVKPSARPKTVPVSDHSDEEEILKKPAARKARAAASKPVQYDVGGRSESDDSNGDDLLGDITSMVKGLPGGEKKSSTDSKSLFSTSRAIPNGSASLKATAPPRATKSYAEISDDDDTNFMGLVPQQSPRRSINITKNAFLTDDEEESQDDIRPLTTNKSRPAVVKPTIPAAAEKVKPAVKSESEIDENHGDDSDDSDEGSDDIVITKTKTKSRPAASSSRPATATATSKAKSSKAGTTKTVAAKKDPVPKKSKPAPAKKTTTLLSPAAKAYAAKQAKNIKKNQSLPSDDEDEAIDAMADDLLDSPVPGHKGPGARKEASSDDEDSPPVKKAAAARPARRAAAAKKQPVYVLSDDDDDDDGSGYGQVGFEDEDDDSVVDPEIDEGF